MTSIEFLMQEIMGKDFRLTISDNDLNKYQEAVEMHKAEIIKANRDGVDMAVDKKPFIMGEQYYQEMFELEQQLDIPSHMRWHNKELPQQEISDGAKDTADYIDRHIIESMKELAKEGFKPKLSEISDEEIEKAARDYDNSVIYGPPLLHFEQGAFWYREQLKQK